MQVKYEKSRCSDYMYGTYKLMEAVSNEDMSGVKGAIIAEVDSSFQTNSWHRSHVY